MQSLTEFHDAAVNYEEIVSIIRVSSISHDGQREDPVSNDAEHEASDEKDKNKFLHGKGRLGLFDFGHILAAKGCDLKRENPTASL